MDLHIKGQSARHGRQPAGETRFGRPADLPAGQSCALDGGDA